MLATGFGPGHGEMPLVRPTASKVASARPDAGYVTLYSGGLVGTVPVSPSETWDEALSAPVYEADAVWPSLAEPLAAGIELWLDRSTPFSVVTADRRLSARGFGRTVGEGLASAGVYLFGRDRVMPALDTPLLPHLAVRVDRVWDEVEIAQETTPFETIWQGDPELELDQARLVREGQAGVLLRRYKLTYVNAALQDRDLEDWWIQQEPLDRLMAYGTQVVPRAIDTGGGVRQYWRRIRVLITAYSPSTAGQARTSPHYGITRTGQYLRPWLRCRCRRGYGRQHHR
jgi:hypothetical protein